MGELVLTWTLGTIGTYQQTARLVFDKDRIRHDLAMNIYRFRFCPYLREKFIDAVVVSLPEKVEITENGPWKYNVTYEETPGSIKVVQRKGESDFCYIREYYVDGVRPRGLLPLKEILTGAYSISQSKPEISADELVKK
jgi:hypothetical protein